MNVIAGKMVTKGVGPRNKCEDDEVERLAVLVKNVPTSSCPHSVRVSTPSFAVATTIKSMSTGQSLLVEMLS
jgi:hypothetical protein